MKNILSMNKVTKKFEKFTLENVSMNLPYGFIMGLIGPNGSGKTTLIKLIMNLIIKNQGKIEIFGRDHAEFEDQIKERIGFVYEIPRYYDHLRLSQTISLISPFYKKWDNRVFNEWCEKFSIDPTQKFKVLSKGMKMKFSIAVALSHEADLLLLDEPTSGLDPVFRREFLNLLAGIIQDGNKSVLYSTHITSDLDRVADYITFLDQGKMIFSTDTEQIKDNWGILKSRKNLNSVPGLEIKGISKTGQGYEMLISNLIESKKILADREVIFDPATLEDIMVNFSNDQPVREKTNDPI